MTKEVRKFMASDAIAYVDTYRRLIMNTPTDILSSRERLEAKILELPLVPSRLYAERSAHEHALGFVTDRHEPGMVVLGPQEETPVGPSADAEARRQLEEEVADLRQRLRQAAQREQELEGQLVVKGQEVAGAYRKLAQAQNSMAVGGIAMAVVILVLLIVMVAR